MASNVIGFSNHEQTLKLYNISEVDIKLIQKYSKEAGKHIETFLNDFYAWIPDVPEFNVLFSRPGLVEQVKKQQDLYWRQFFDCKIK